MKPVVIAITGASGSIYAVRLLEVLLAERRDVHLVISPAAKEVFQHELGIKIDLDHFSMEHILLNPSMVDEDLESESASNALSSILQQVAGGSLTYSHYQDYNSGIASGSFLTTGMVICP